MDNHYKVFHFDNGSPTVYCPICERVIFAENEPEVNCGYHDAYIYIHDDITHDESDMEALANGIH